MKQKCREGVPPKFRAVIWRHLVDNHLNLTPEYYFELCSTIQTRLLEEIEVQVENDPLKIVIEQRTKSDQLNNNPTSQDTNTISVQQLVDRNVHLLQETLSTPPRSWKQQPKTSLISTKKRPIQEVKGTTKSQSLFRALN